MGELACVEQYAKALWALPLIEKPPIVVFGRPAKQGRDVNFFSDFSRGYRYSGQIMLSQPLTPELKALLDLVNEKFKDSFNGILVNCYRNGADCIGAHSDDETTLGTSGVISLSLGATRKLRIRDKKTKKLVGDFECSHGTLMHMSGDFQKHYTHEIPKQLRITTARLSLTFRHHNE
jgi:alkylated DNA repair dioxygenase AlkB